MTLRSTAGTTSIKVPSSNLMAPATGDCWGSSGGGGLGFVSQQTAVELSLGQQYSPRPISWKENNSKILVLICLLNKIESSDKVGVPFKRDSKWSPNSRATLKALSLRPLIWREQSNYFSWHYHHCPISTRTTCSDSFSYFCVSDTWNKKKVLVVSSRAKLQFVEKE